MPRVLFIALVLVFGSAGCRKKPPAATTPTNPFEPASAARPADASSRGDTIEPPAAAGSDSPRRDSESIADERPRQPIDLAEIDPEDDPELTDDYFGGVEDGKSAEPPPRPTHLPGDRAFSIGPPNGGWLINGKPMPLRERWHRVLPGTAERGWYFATDTLLGLIQRAAQATGERHGGAPLRVGNLSRRDGGKIAPSVSHQSGRDADIGLFATDLDGETVDPGGFPKFDGTHGDGMVDTTGQYVFDVARNWTFVEALLRDSGARLQWIFLDTPLEQILLDYAVRTHVNAELIARAEKVIVRPSNSSPHANHFHIRIFCTQGDIEYGCKDLGPEWDWVGEARAVDAQLLDGIVEDIMAGRRQVDLLNPESGTPGPVNGPDPDGLRTPPIGLPTKVPPAGASSPDQLPDPPTDVPLKGSL